MTNRVTQEERESILARAKQLLALHGKTAADRISDTLITEFNISPARARSAMAKAILLSRGEAMRHGGQRPGAGRPTNQKRGLPEARTWEDYEVIRFPRPASDREEAALEWFKDLEPFERMSAIIKLYYS